MYTVRESRALYLLISLVELWFLHIDLHLVYHLNLDIVHYTDLHIPIFTVGLS